MLRPLRRRRQKMDEEAATPTSAVPPRARGLSMLIIENQAHFDEVVAFAKRSGKYEPAVGEEGNSCLKSRLDYLESYGGKGEDSESQMRVRLFKDFAPYSFGFVMEQRGTDGQYQHVLTGGLLFHGTIDGYGSGQGPTLSVTLTPVDGWAIHT
jgi:hypothetical protein